MGYELQARWGCQSLWDDQPPVDQMKFVLRSLMQPTHEWALPGIGCSSGCMAHIEKVFHSHCQAGKRAMLGPLDA